MRSATLSLAGTAILLLSMPALAAPTMPLVTTPMESAAIANPDGEAPVPLSAITTPPARMATANLLDANGQTVGAVQRVDLGANGAPAQVSVALIGGGDKLLVLDAGQVKYDPVRNAILAAEPAERIKAMARNG